MLNTLTKHPPFFCHSNAAVTSLAVEFSDTLASRLAARALRTHLSYRLLLSPHPPTMLVLCGLLLYTLKPALTAAAATAAAAT